MIIVVVFYFRFLFLKKIPTMRKLLSAAIVVLGLFICLIPTIFPCIDPKASTKHDLGGATGLARIFWPIAFMFGFVSRNWFLASIILYIKLVFLFSFFLFLFVAIPVK